MKMKLKNVTSPKKGLENDVNVVGHQLAFFELYEYNYKTGELINTIFAVADERCWNGEKWLDAWECDKDGYAIESGRTFDIKPVYGDFDEDDDESFKAIDFVW